MVAEGQEITDDLRTKVRWRWCQRHAHHQAVSALLGNGLIHAQVRGGAARVSM